MARLAARQFREGDSLLVDAGSTTALFAAELGRVGSFTVITNSLLVARELRDAPRKSEVYLLGGRYFGEGDEVLGPLVVEQIQRLQADHAVLTVGAVDEAGRCLDFNAEEAYIARAMIASAHKTTILADSSKLGRHALFQVCEAGADRPARHRPARRRAFWATGSAPRASSPRRRRSAAAQRVRRCNREISHDDRSVIFDVDLLTA